jgi:hypothetical protein
MKEWRVRGSKADSIKLVEIIVEANTWAGAVAEATAGAHQLTVRDAVRSDLEKLTIDRLVSVHGWTSYENHPWTSYRERPFFTTKDYPTAVGPKRAVVRPVVPDNGMGQLWLVGEYISEGNNALVGAMAIIHQDAADDVVYEHVDAFAQKVSQRISETYAARLLKAA